MNSHDTFGSGRLWEKEIHFGSDLNPDSIYKLFFTLSCEPVRLAQINSK